MRSLFFLLSLFMSFSLLAQTIWTSGTYKIELHSAGEAGLVSKSCLKDCALKSLVKNRRSELKGMDMSGGKDPASVFCKHIGMTVTYMSSKGIEETFCRDNEFKDVISLDILL